MKTRSGSTKAAPTVSAAPRVPGAAAANLKAKRSAVAPLRPEAGIFGRRRRNPDDVEPMLMFVAMRQLRGRENRALRDEFENDGWARREIARRIINKMEKDGVDVEDDSDESETPRLDWIRDNWAWILQAIKDLLGMFAGGGGIPIPG